MAPTSGSRLEFGEITHPYSNPVGEPDFGLIVSADNTPGSDNAVVFMADSGGALIPGHKGFIQAAAGGSTNATPSDTHTSTSWVESWSSWFVGRLG